MQPNTPVGAVANTKALGPNSAKNRQAGTVPRAPLAGPWCPPTGGFGAGATFSGAGPAGGFGAAPTMVSGPGVSDGFGAAPTVSATGVTSGFGAAATVSGTGVTGGFGAAPAAYGTGVTGGFAAAPAAYGPGQWQPPTGGWGKGPPAASGWESGGGAMHPPTGGCDPLGGQGIWLGLLSYMAINHTKVKPKPQKPSTLRDFKLFPVPSGMHPPEWGGHGAHAEMMPPEWGGPGAPAETNAAGCVTPG